MSKLGSRLKSTADVGVLPATKRSAEYFRGVVWLTMRKLGSRPELILHFLTNLM